MERMGLKSKHVLLVDQDAESRARLRKVLENVGIIVSEAGNVDLALKTAETNVPHLVLLDLQMPGQSGYSFLSRCRGVKALFSVPVMVVSAARDRDSVFKAVGLGAADYLVKPVAAALLLQKVRKVLKDQEFSSYVVKDPASRAARMTFAGVVSNLTDAGFTLQSSVKIAGQSRVQLKIGVDPSPELSNCVFQTYPEGAIPGALGRYFNKINAVGVDEPLLSKFQRARARNSGRGGS